MMSEINSEMKDRLGNIHQIREILFGEQIQGYENRFQLLEQNIENLHQEMQKQIDDLKNILTIELQDSVASLEKKLQYLSAAADEEITDIRDELELNGQKVSTQFAALDSSSNSKIQALKLEISHTRESLQNDINTLRSNLWEELEKKYKSLVESKASKDEIAELFFEFCMKLKGQNYRSKSPKDDLETNNRELLLPESNE